MKSLFLAVALFLIPSLTGAGIFDFFSGLWSSDDQKPATEAAPRNASPPNSSIFGGLRAGVTKLNVRQKPSREARILKQIDSGVQFEVLSSKPGFVLIVHDGETAYVQESCVEKNAFRIRPGVTALNVRSGPEADASVIKQVNGGITFELLSRVGDRMQVKFADQVTGYIHQDYAESEARFTKNCEAQSEPGAGTQVGSITEGQSARMAELDFVHIRLAEGTVGWIASSFLHSETTEGSAQNLVLDYQAQSDLVARLHHRLKVVDLLAIKVFFTQKEISPLRLRLSDFRGSLRGVFRDDSELAREYAQELLNESDDVLRNDYLALLKMMNSTTLLRACGGQVSTSIKDAVACIQTKRDTKNSSDREVSGKPRIMVNLPGSYLQVFDDEGILLDYRVVIGHPEHKDNRAGDNSKTRVGDFRILSWHENYSNQDYPAWDKEPLKAAFGKWTAKLNDRHAQYIHGTIGYALIDWAAIRLAPGSHGCIRSQNSDIEKVKNLCEAGTAVRKFYVTREISWEGNSTKLLALDNPYDYQDIESNGYYYRGSGILVDYKHPSDAVTDR